MKSAVINPRVVDDYLTKDVECEKLIGPFELDALTKAHVDHFGLISKSHCPGEWRLIADLSHPAVVSVNDGIESELCTMKYR